NGGGNGGDNEQPTASGGSGGQAPPTFSSAGPTPTSAGGSSGGSSDAEPTATIEDMDVSESGGELVVALTPDPLQMSPWLPNSMPGFSIHYHIYEPTLFRDENMELLPILAESVEQVSPDTIEIKLREGIKF